MDAGKPTAVKPGCPVAGNGPPWFIAAVTATPVGILSLSRRPTRWRSGGDSFAYNDIIRRRMVSE